MYVEIGVWNPLLLSSTLFFDKCLGWRGVCFEANPKWHKAIRASRSCTLVPHCALGTAGSVRLATPAHGRQDAGTHVVRPGASLAHNEALTVREERCVVASDELIRLGVNRVDLLSVDVEGAEADVLRCFPLDALKVRAVLLETNRIQSMRSLDRFFHARGYVNRETFIEPSSNDGRTHRGWLDNVFVRSDGGPTRYPPNTRWPGTYRGWQPGNTKHENADNDWDPHAPCAAAAGAEASSSRRLDREVSAGMLEPPVPSSSSSSSSPSASSSHWHLLVSIASVPSRFHMLKPAVNELLTLQERPPDGILLVVAKSYKNFGVSDGDKQHLQEAIDAAPGPHRGKAELFWRERDDGPLTKLLGAIEYLQTKVTSDLAARTLLVTLDDDITYPSWALSTLLHYSNEVSKLDPAAVVTFYGTNYNGAPSVEKMAQGNRVKFEYVTWMSPGAASEGVTTPASCKLYTVNHLYGYVGVAYPPTLLSRAAIAEPSNVLQLTKDCWPCDDQYISGHVLSVNSSVFLASPPKSALEADLTRLINADDGSLNAEQRLVKVWIKKEMASGSLLMNSNKTVMLRPDGKFYGRVQKEFVESHWRKRTRVSAASIHTKAWDKKRMTQLATTMSRFPPAVWSEKRPAVRVPCVPE